jgi:hypothetical protein
MLLQGGMLDLAAEKEQQQRLQLRQELQQQMEGMILNHEATKNGERADCKQLSACHVSVVSMSC